MFYLSRKLVINVEYYYVLQEKLAALENIENVEFNLYCAGSLLENEAIVGDLPFHTLELIVPLLGGKLIIVLILT